jgi:DNA-binding CsgD family transcriptional regulator
MVSSHDARAMESAAPIALRIAEAAVGASSLTAFRARCLALLREVVPFDRAAFHAFSPRVPLETGAFVDLDLAALAGSTERWDSFAVELGRLRDLANQELVASDRVAFPRGTPSRARFLELVGGPLRIRSMLMVHLVVRERVRSAIALFGKDEGTFPDEHVVLLRALAPTLAVADALCQAEHEAPRAEVPRRFVCRDGRLTPRQREIVEHVAMGHTNAEIARAMGVSPNTLRNHLAAVFARVGASNRADLVRLAVLTRPPEDPAATRRSIW